MSAGITEQERKKTHIEQLHLSLTNQNEELAGYLNRLNTICTRFQNVPPDPNKTAEQKAVFAEGALNALDNAINHNKHLVNGIRECVYKLEEVV